MEKKVLIGTACVVALLLVGAVFWNQKTEPQDDTPAMMERIDKAIQSVDGSCKKQSVTQVFPINYADEDGNKIVFYQCHTEYYEADPAEVIGLNMDAILSVVEVPEERWDCTVKEWSAAWFEDADRAYLCWTISPKVSCILEYDPDVVEKSDIFKMAESVE